MTDTSGSYTRLVRTVRTLLKLRREGKRPLLVGTVILVFLSIFTKSQASSPFEAMNSVSPLNVSKGCEALCPEVVEDYVFL